MPITANDISFTFSGGAANSKPDLSLGGEPSLQIITNKRLFADITKSQAAEGFTDHRCFYLHNDSNTEMLFDAALEVALVNNVELQVQLGFVFADEKQLITITNADTVSGGTFTLTYTDISSQQNIEVAWDADVDVLALNLQSGIRELLYLEEVEVSGSSSGSSYTLEVNFVGTAGDRFHDILLLQENDLTSSEPTAIGIEKAISGGPINSIADEIDVGTTTPFGVDFFDVFTVTSIGDMRPLDSVPVWVKRIIPAGATPFENDGFTFRVSGATAIP